MQDASAWAPSALLFPLMDWLWAQRFTPEPPWRGRRGAASARWLLYVRAHWLRMPPLMLARHLSFKALRMARDGLDRKFGSAAS